MLYDTVHMSCQSIGIIKKKKYTATATDTRNTATSSVSHHQHRAAPAAGGRVLDGQGRREKEGEEKETRGIIIE